MNATTTAPAAALVLDKLDEVRIALRCSLREVAACGDSEWPSSSRWVLVGLLDDVEALAGGLGAITTPDQVHTLQNAAHALRSQLYILVASANAEYLQSVPEVARGLDVAHSGLVIARKCADEVLDAVDLWEAAAYQEARSLA